MADEPMKELKMKIVDVYEVNDQLRVKVESIYGLDNLGLGLHAKYVNPLTGEPAFIEQTRKLLQKKYGTHIDAQNKSPAFQEKANFEEHIGREINLAENPPKVSGWAKRLYAIGLNRDKIAEIEAAFTDYGALREAVLSDAKLPFDAVTNELLEDYYGGTSLGFTKEKHLKNLRHAGETELKKREEARAKKP